MHAHSHIAAPITSVTDGFSSSSLLNEYKYVCLTSFICQGGAHFLNLAKRGSVAIYSAGEESLQEKGGKLRRSRGESTGGDKDDPEESNKFDAKQRIWLNARYELSFLDESRKTKTLSFKTHFYSCPSDFLIKSDPIFSPLHSLRSQ